MTIFPKARRERRERIARYCKRLSWSQTVNDRFKIPNKDN